MEIELRSILLVVGIVFIAAILIHGLIGIRKANKPVDLSGIDLTEHDSEGKSGRDGSGFDRHGVGEVRVIGSNDETQSEPAKAIDDGPLNLELPDVSTPEGSGGNINFDVALETPADNINGDNPPNGLTAEPLFDSPIFREKPVSQAPAQQQEQLQQPDLASVDSTPADIESVATVVTRLNNAIVDPVPSPEPMDVLVLNVIASDDNELNGAQLLPILLTLGFKFGDMDIFHRYANSAGQGEILFSLANMVKPGVFDIDNMEQFTTSGVSLFMTLPHNQGNLKTFNLMLNAAAKIAEEFSGQVLDGNRSTLTKQSTQHYVERIREVERKLLLTK